MDWLGVVLLFVGLLVDIVTKFETGVGYDENGDTRGWNNIFQKSTMYFMLLIFVLFQLVMVGEFTLTCH